jgi:enoyl-CoA hydratase
MQLPPSAPMSFEELQMMPTQVSTLSAYQDFAPSLLVEKRDAVHLLTINRPEAFNAINEPLHRGLEGIWRVLREDNEVRAVVVTGAGSKAFSAGGDMGMLLRMISDLDLRARQVSGARTLFTEVINFDKPLVSAVNGAAVGLGCSLALLSDLLVMGESSYLSDPHVAVGLTAGDGGAAMLPLLIGMTKAKEYVLLGEKITAPIAKQLNLVSRVVADDKVLDEALTLADSLAALPVQAVRSTKAAMNLHFGRAALGVLEYSLAAEYTSFSTKEFRDRVTRFIARSEEAKRAASS